MQQTKIQILSTRPLDNALIDEAALNNIIIDIMSFIKTEKFINAEAKKRITELLTQNATVIFTSINAVNALKKYVSPALFWKIYCIGNTTKNLVTQVFGKESIAGFAYNGGQLSEVILNNNLLKKVIFFCGDKRRDEIPETLEKNKVAVEEIIVYKTIETPGTIRKEYDGILFYSPGAVESFFKKNAISGRTQLFAIGATTANAIEQFSNQPVISAEIPGKENLVNVAVNYFSKRQTS
jgi:uroporphyrinogen-III synthase